MSTIGTAQGSTHAKTPLGKIQPVAYTSSDAAEGHPSDIFLTHTSLQHEIFDETSHSVLSERCNDSRVHAEAASETTRHVVFASALPYAKETRCGDALIAGIESQHAFSQTDQVPDAAGLCFDLEFRHEFRQIHSRKPGYRTCWRRMRDSCSATILSSPGCSMNEFIPKPGRCSPPPIAIDGFELRRSFEASFGVSEIRAASHVICICGTWLAISGVKKDVLTPGTFVISPEIRSSRDCHSFASASWSSLRKSSSALTIPTISSLPTF